MNPEQYEKWMREHWPEILAAKTKESAEAIRDGFVMLTEGVREAARQIGKNLAELAEEIHAAGYIRADNQTRNTDSNLQNKSETEYIMYYDNKNDRLVTEYRTKGEEKDGKDGIDSSNVGNGLPDRVGGPGPDDPGGLLCSRSQGADREKVRRI